MNNIVGMRTIVEIKRVEGEEIEAIPGTRGRSGGVRIARAAIRQDPTTAGKYHSKCW